ncbi:Nn.00g062690.m01.CDS01 [Neocucurbitaria sp. VM-36]
MPLWIIYHPPTTFENVEIKRDCARSITSIYTVAKLLAFYVNDLFQALQPTSFYDGVVARPSSDSEANKPSQDSSRPFIKITIQSVAREI